jgi:predicted  nucleic acid-binding Zn-ribbon protein
MFRRLVEWTLSLINVSQELDRHRVAIRDLNARNRDLEEAFKLLSQELRHQRELAAAEREKLLLKIEGIVAKGQPALPKRRRGKAK